MDITTTNEFVKKKKQKYSFDKNDKKENVEDENQQKKCNSSETKKSKELGIKEIKYFMARIDPKYENQIFEDKDKLSDKDLNFEYRRDRANEIINSIKEGQDELEYIQQSLRYDNTNKTAIYLLLEYYYKNKDKKKFEEALAKYKYCITQKFTINKKGKKIFVDLNELCEINLPIEELEELPNSAKNENGLNDLRNSVVEFFTSYFHISQYITEFNKIIEKEALKSILTIKYTKSSNNNFFMLNYENEEKQKLLPTNEEMKKLKEEGEEKEEEDSNEEEIADNLENTETIKKEKSSDNKILNKEKKDKDNKDDKINRNEIKDEEIKDNEGNKKEEKDVKNENEKEKDKRDKLLESIKNYLCNYIYYQDFDLKEINQPIDFRNNLTLFYNYIIWSLYHITIKVDESKNTIYIKKNKLLIYSSLEEFHNLLFDDYFDKEVPFNNIMNQLIQYLLLILTNERIRNFEFIYKYIHLKEDFIDKKSAKEFMKKLNKNYKFLDAKKIKGQKGLIVFKEEKKMKCKEIIIKYNNYTKNKLLSDELPKTINWLWTKVNFNSFQETNFFLQEDLDYLKFLIKHILSSKLFHSIFDKFNNVSSVSDYYFSFSKNIDDYIGRIVFLPFRKKDIHKFASNDRRMLSILVSGFPENNIYNLEEYRIYRLIELSLKVVVLALHEPSHFIKAACSLITEGIISRNTSSDKNNNCEGGFLLEEVFFGWICDGNNPLDLVGMKLLDEDIKCKNKAINNKEIDLVTALKLLDPDIYNGDLNYFRKSIFNLSRENLKTFSFSPSSNERYKSYIESVIDIETIRDSWDCDYSISAAMGSFEGISVKYKSDNHNNTRDNDNKIN